MARVQGNARRNTNQPDNMWGWDRGIGSAEHDSKTEILWAGVKVKNGQDGAREKKKNGGIWMWRKGAAWKKGLKVLSKEPGKKQ